MYHLGLHILVLHTLFAETLHDLLIDNVLRKRTICLTRNIE